MVQKKEAQEKPTHVIIPVELNEKILEYMVDQPYKEVAGILSSLKQQGRYINIPPEEKEEKNKQEKKEPVKKRSK